MGVESIVARAERPVVLELHNVEKDYRGLRPLRIGHLQLREGQTLALLGFDRAAAEVLINLMTGAITPDSGDVRVFGQSTRDIVDSDAWLSLLDGIGLLTDRAVLLDGLTVEQNLAMPFTLALDSIPDTVKARVSTLAADVDLDAAELSQPVAVTSALTQLRLRLARAIALGPRVLLAEHPNASLSSDELPAFARVFAKLTTQRRMASVTLTADSAFAASIAERVLSVKPATGALREIALWRRWFSRP